MFNYEMMGEYNDLSVRFDDTRDKWFQVHSCRFVICYPNQLFVATALSLGGAYPITVSSVCRQVAYLVW